MALPLPVELRASTEWSIGLLRDLFPKGVCVVATNGVDDPHPLMPGEVDAVSRAVPSRRREFALGRWCARRALGGLGIAPQSIPVGEGRAPTWPHGVVGSITHCREFVAAAVARVE